MSTRTHSNRKAGRRAGIATVIAAALAVTSAACSTDASSDTGAGTSDVTVDAMEPVTQVNLPEVAFDAPEDKHILIVVCGNAGFGCVRAADAAKEAGEELGWKVDTIDGRFDPTVWNRAVKQAVDQGIDGIVSASADPNLMGEAMQQVAENNVPFVVVAQSPKAGDVAGVTSWLRSNPETGGESVAEWIQADSDDEANVLVVDAPEFTDIMQRNDTIVSTLERDCADCTVLRVEAAAQTAGTTLAPLITAQLQQHPDINYIWGPDDSVGDFIAQGIQQAGKASSVKLLSTSSTTPSSVERLKSGTQAADLVYSDYFNGWLAIDALARAMAGEDVQESWDMPLRLFTSANLDEAPSDLDEVGWNPEFDYKTEFRTLWGIS